jgi:FAD/FMN-containing dehydrogenase
MQSFKDLEFQNWGRTVSNTPAITCVPNTAQDVADIVTYAKKHNMGVRVAGFRKQRAMLTQYS